MTKMYTEETNSIFENDDEFGIQEYRQDINILIAMNSIQVRRISKNPKTIESQQGDFLGIRTKTYSDNSEIIKLCINSSNSKSNRLTEEGYHGRGEIRFNCYASFNTEVDNKDIIIFLTDYSYGIKEGDRFRVEMKETGPWKGQYSYKNFDIIKIA